MRGKAVFECLLLLGLLLSAVLFRLPPLMNAEALPNSDTAVVGLQARHFLQGEFSWLIWGTSYQGALEVVMAALTSLAFADRPALGLALSAVLAHLVLLAALFRLLRLSFDPWLAWVATSALAFGPSSLNTWTLNPPRQWSFALLMVGVYWVERAAAASSTRSRLKGAGAAGLAVALGYYSDLFLMVMLPGAALQFGWALRAMPRADRWRATAFAAAGFLIGSIPRWAAGMAKGGLKELSFRNIPSHGPLFRECMKALFGWDAPLPSAMIWGGAAVFATVLVTGSLHALMLRCPAPERRLAWCGAAWVWAAIASFLLSARAVDLGSTRYLLPVVLGLPLIAPAAIGMVAARRSRSILTAVLASVPLWFTAEGWSRYGDWVDHWLPVRGADAGAPGEMALLHELQLRGVDAVVAEYWAAYRLTFLWGERLVVVDPDGDRYLGYREPARHARRVAWLTGSPADAISNQLETELKRAQRPYQRLTLAGRELLLIEGALNPVTVAAKIEVTGSLVELESGEHSTLQLRITNTGLFGWNPKEVFCSYHLRDARGRMHTFDGQRTALPAAVMPGESALIELQLQAPGRPGRYVLEIDLVQELVTWFAERHDGVARVPFTVRSPAQTPG